MVVTAGICSLADAANPPNIVMIISDDQSWTDYSFMHHPDIRTPHLDRLASRSAVYRRGYVPTALCRPSLATMITGLYPHQHGITGNDPSPSAQLKAEQYDVLRADLIANIDQHATLPKLLSEKGYISHQSGKWWEGNFSRGGFTEGMTRGFPQKGGRHGDDGLDIGRTGMQPVLSFIDKAKAADKPFFVWYAPFLPHTPHNPPERILSKYVADGRPLELAKYYAMCDWFDETCGQLLDHLDQQELTNDTLVVYVTDNGWIQSTDANRPNPAWKQGFAPRSKQSPYDGGTRTPILFSWPGVIEPGDRPQLVSSIDLLPTLVAAAGAKSPEGLPGLNLLPVLKDNAPLERNVLYGESFAHDVADLNDPEASLLFRWCIEGNYKLLLSYPGKANRYASVFADYDRQPQLFDLQADPFEESNLAKQHPDVVARLNRHINDVWQTTVQPYEK